MVLTLLARKMVSSIKSHPKKKFKILGVHALDLRICLEFQTLKVAYNSRVKSIDAVFQAGFNGKFNIGSLIIKLWFHLMEKIFMY